MWSWGVQNKMPKQTLMPLGLWSCYGDTHCRFSQLPPWAMRSLHRVELGHPRPGELEPKDVGVFLDPCRRGRPARPRQAEDRTRRREKKKRGLRNKMSRSIFRNSERDGSACRGKTRRARHNLGGKFRSSDTPVCGIGPHKQHEGGRGLTLAVLGPERGGVRAPGATCK